LVTAGAKNIVWEGERKKKKRFFPKASVQKHGVIRPNKKPEFTTKKKKKLKKQKGKTLLREEGPQKKNRLEEAPAA